MIGSIDTLRSPPRVGANYLVPTIEHNWAGQLFAWPVLLPMHTDPDLGFDLPHWNVDARFITAEMERHLTAQLRHAYPPAKVASRSAFHLAATMVLADERGSKFLPHVPTWRALECRRATSPATQFPDWMAECIQAQFSSPARPRKRGGRMYCPHRGADLTAIKPDRQGFVRCPLHGLRVQVRG